MAAPTRQITIPIGLYSSNPVGDQSLQKEVDQKIAAAVEQAALDGWYPTSATDFTSLWVAARISSHAETNWMGNITRVDSVSVELAYRPAEQLHYADSQPEESPDAVSAPSILTIACPRCGQDASVFDVHCACGAYLPSRPVDKQLQNRILRAFDQHEADKRSAAEAAAKAAEAAARAGESGLGKRIAVGVGAGLLAMVGGIAEASILSDADLRLQYNIERGIRRAK